MAIQFKRGTTSNRTNYTPAAGELIVVDVDQVNPSIYVGDGSTAGGKLASAQGGGGVSEAFKTISISVKFLKKDINIFSILIQRMF